MYSLFLLWPEEFLEVVEKDVCALDADSARDFMGPWFLFLFETRRVNMKAQSFMRLSEDARCVGIAIPQRNHACLFLFVQLTNQSIVEQCSIVWVLPRSSFGAGKMVYYKRISDLGAISQQILHPTPPKIFLKCVLQASLSL